MFFEPPRPNDDLDPSEEPTVTKHTVPSFDHPLNQLNIIANLAILAFLAERVNTHQAFHDQLDTMLEPSKTEPLVSLAAANAIMILVRAGTHFNGRNLQAIRISGADLSGGEFDMTDLQDADMSNVNLTEAWLRQVDLRKTRMIGVQFGELPYLVEGGVRCCAYSPDGLTFASGCQNGTITI